jgi:hypothetical protein
MRATINAGLDHADKSSTGDLDTRISARSALHYAPQAIDYYLNLPASAPPTLEGRTPSRARLPARTHRGARQKVLDGKARGSFDDFGSHGRFLRERLSSGAGSLDISKEVRSRGAKSAHDNLLDTSVHGSARCSNHAGAPR